MSWASLFHLGDLSVTIPAAGAIAAWLLIARAWRAALGWGLVFCLALALVAATKIAFMAWDTGLPTLHYQALSGHATGFAAVCPTLCYLLTQRYGHDARVLASGLGVLLAAVVAVALVQARQHSPAEALAGWMIGTGAFLAVVYLGGEVPAPPAGRALAGSMLAFAATAWAIGSLPFGYWMIRLALVLSGNHHPFSWDRC